MRILITAFEPFQQETINATMEALPCFPIISTDTPSSSASCRWSSARPSLPWKG